MSRRDDFGDMEGPAEIVPSDVSDLSEDGKYISCAQAV